QAAAEAEAEARPVEEPRTTRRRAAAPAEGTEDMAASAAGAGSAGAAPSDVEVATPTPVAEPARAEPRVEEPTVRGEPAREERPAASATPPGATPVVPAPSAPSRPSAPPRAAAPASPQAPSDGRPRPRPIVPNAPRPRPVASSGYMPPRPIASAAPGGGAAAPPRREEKRTPSAPIDRRRGKKGRRGAVDQEAVDTNIAKTMASMRGAPSRRGGRRDDGGREEMETQRAAEVEREKKTVRVNEFVTVSELAQTLRVSPTEIVSFAFKNLGLMVTINQRLDFDQIELIASEFGFQAVREEEYQAEDVADVQVDEPESLVSRPPVVTIMGHVDHGKTSLLDYIRRANVVAGEAGGITQHIGAYNVTVAGDRNLTFLDTPGHEAFTAMRARGAQVTDIVVLVVAADDQVMPQTVEAISHAKNAGVPIIVAINKIDLPSANPTKVKQDLLQHGVVVEDFGGTVLSTPISAKKGTGVPELLDQVLLQAELLDLKANPDRRAAGTVVEAQLDPGKGPVATVLVQSGTLRVGDDFICGLYSGRVRALLDERGKAVKEAGPAIPVQVLGMSGVPMAGDQFLVVEDAQQAREIAQRRERLDREAKSRRTSRGVAVSLEDFMSQTAGQEARSLKLLIKADQGGPAEALADALQQLSTGEVKVEVVQRGVGAISESDILLAKASGAVIIGFHVRPDNKARAAAEREGVDIKLYRIIYEAVSDVRAALEGLLRPEEREVVVAEVEVRQTFKVPKIGVVAGCYVRSGTVTRGSRVRVIRDGVEVYEGNLGTLRRFKDDVREVKEGFECGIGIENFNDVKIGDVLEFFRTEEVARTLESSGQG
ncbi:MAG TPA: translation initiation factor IF-2, partial [Gemmatimonadaceae bacterium]